MIRLQIICDRCGKHGAHIDGPRPLAHRVRALLRENGWRTRNSNGGSGDGPVDICPECWARGER